jgi:hypothetical protein
MARNLEHRPLTDKLDRLDRPAPARLRRVAAAGLAVLALAQGGQALAAGQASEPSSASSASPSVPASPGQALLADVQRLIGRAACTADAQCRSLALGARACGGPDAYVAWSVLGTDEAALRRAAGRYGQWQAQAQARRSVASICMVEADPGAVCARDAAAGAQSLGRCVLGTGGQAGVSR